METKIVVNDEQREKDIQKLCIQILEMSTNFWDNPNGAYESSCPFCYATEYRDGGENYHAKMSELKHTPNCSYLIAKDLSTNCYQINK